MIDPATGWFEIAEIPHRTADYIANYIEFHWLTRYPWPTEIVMDRGKEFAAEVKNKLCPHYGMTRKVITTRNPTANAIIERAHKVVNQMVDAHCIEDKQDLDPDFLWQPILASIRAAMRAVVHTTTRATPSQLVFGRDAMLNVTFEADWQYIKERKQRLIVQNNRKENAKRVPHTYRVGDRVMIRLDPSRKHGSPKYSGPHTLTVIKDNGTVTLRKDTNDGGAVHETWNIRNLEPYEA
jgi:ribosomal protein L21E